MEYLSYFIKSVNIWSWLLLHFPARKEEYSYFLSIKKFKNYCPICELYLKMYKIECNKCELYKQCLTNYKTWYDFVYYGKGKYFEAQKAVYNICKALHKVYLKKLKEV